MAINTAQGMLHTEILLTSLNSLAIILFGIQLPEIYKKYSKLFKNCLLVNRSNIYYDYPANEVTGSIHVYTN